MKMFITSNQQFGRQSANALENRGFANVEEMNDHLIEQWNSVVSDGDMVYVAGNFAWDPESLEYAIKRLNGSMVVMGGEMDHAIYDFASKIGEESGVAYTPDQIKILKSLNVVISYWPLKTWPNKDKNSISIVGHPDKEYKTSHVDKVINVSCDMWDFKPVNVKDMLQLFEDPDLMKKD